MTWVTDRVQQGLVALTTPGHPGCLWGHRAVPSTTRDCPVGPSKGTSPGMVTSVNPEPCGCSAWPQCQGRAEVQPGTQVLKSESIRCTSTCSHTYSNRAGKDKRGMRGKRGHELKCSSEERETLAETSPSSSCPSSLPAMWSQVTQPSHSKAVLRSCCQIPRRVKGLHSLLVHTEPQLLHWQEFLTLRYSSKSKLSL